MVEAAHHSVDKSKTLTYIDSQWDPWFVTGLSDFISCPNLTPMVDDQYLTNGLVEKCI
jgi:acetylornithine deacetylase/succinyl-diaminopimelate desuccinylase-like protein